MILKHETVVLVYYLMSIKILFGQKTKIKIQPQKRTVMMDNTNRVPFCFNLQQRLNHNNWNVSNLIEYIFYRRFLEITSRFVYQNEKVLNFLLSIQLLVGDIFPSLILYTESTNKVVDLRQFFQKTFYT
jgi:hypothetical protein